jgi:predicted 3-demethylubiquinone-9 3-methyltransferase (glyoxalase superfamily)
MSSKLRPFLWFNDGAPAAAKFYVSVFPSARLLSSDARSASFVWQGVEFILFNGGPHLKVTPAVSFFVTCRTQREIDYYWKKLSVGGEILRCGWVTDKFGVTWQIVPAVLSVLLERDSSGRVMEAMLKMKKLDIAKLKKAAAVRRAR